MHQQCLRLPDDVSERENPIEDYQGILLDTILLATQLPFRIHSGSQRIDTYSALLYYRYLSRVLRLLAEIGQMDDEEQQPNTIVFEITVEGIQNYLRSIQ